MDSSPTDEEAANAFDTSVNWLVHRGYLDVKFVPKLAELRHYALNTSLSSGRREVVWYGAFDLLVFCFPRKLGAKWGLWLEVQPCHDGKARDLSISLPSSLSFQSMTHFHAQQAKLPALCQLGIDVVYSWLAQSRHPELNQNLPSYVENVSFSKPKSLSFK